MKIATAHFAIDLSRQAMLSLADAAGVRFAVDHGSVWITLDGDSRDVVLEAGHAFTTQEHRRALVYALAPSRVGIDGAHGQAFAIK